MFTYCISSTIAENATTVAYVRNDKFVGLYDAQRNQCRSAGDVSRVSEAIAKGFIQLQNLFGEYLGDRLCIQIFALI